MFIVFNIYIKKNHVLIVFFFLKLNKNYSSQKEKMLSLSGSIN